MHLSTRWRRLAAVSSVVAILVVTVLATSSGIAAAAGLFDPATATEMRAAPARAATMRDGLRGSSDGSLRERLVTLNSVELARIVPPAADNDSNRLERAKALNGAVTLDLFPGVAVTAQRNDIQAPEEGGFVWVGRGGSAQPSWVTLVINDNEVFGQVQTGGRLYRIESVSGKLHRIRELDQEKIRDDMHLEASADRLEKRSETEPSSPTTKAAVAASASAPTTINVLVAHTVSARQEVGTAQQMQARINLAVALANQAFANSGANIRFARVGGESEINYDEAAYYGGSSGSNNYVGMLCDLTGVGCSYLGVSNGHTSSFSGLRKKRRNVNADLVILMRKQGAYCGIAWVLDPPTSSTVTYGFSVVTSSPSYGCIEGNSLAHETGHNMGLHHDRAEEKLETGSMPSASKFNFGYVDKTGKFFDIMAYRSSCGNGCTRVPFFSTPLKKYPSATTGRALGIPANVSGAADATRALNGNRATVSAYR
jgi:hypothetical protein